MFAIMNVSLLIDKHTENYIYYQNQSGQDKHGKIFLGK